MASLINTTYVRAGSSPPYLTQAQLWEEEDHYFDSGSNNPHNSPMIPQTIFDRAAYENYTSVFYAFEATVPSNEDLKAALAEVLHHYPHLVGRLSFINGRTCFFLNNWGVLVNETLVETTLAERIPFNPSSEEVRQLLPPVDLSDLLQIQLNRFSCGGLVIGATYHSRVADAQSMSCFFAAWARVVRGLEVEPLPFHDRAAVCRPREPLNVEFDHRSIEFKTTNMTPVESPSVETIIINYSTEFIDRLKAKVLSEEQNFSTFECLLSHTWKKVTEARGLDFETSTQVRIPVNGRTRIQPAVPTEYFGNLVLWAYPSLEVKDLLQNTHAYVAKAIHDAVNHIDSRYFKSFIDFGEQVEGKEPVEDGELDATEPDYGNTLCPNLEVDSWFGYPVQQLDFGSGSPCAFFSVPKKQTEGYINFLPSCDGDGGVDVIVSLLPEHVQVFNEIVHSIDD